MQYWSSRCYWAHWCIDDLAKFMPRWRAGLISDWEFVNRDSIETRRCPYQAVSKYISTFEKTKGNVAIELTDCCVSFMIDDDSLSDWVIVGIARSETEVSEMSDEIVCVNWADSMKEDTIIERSIEILSNAVEQPKTEISIIEIAKRAIRSKRIISIIRVTSQTLKSDNCNLNRQRYIDLSETLSRSIECFSELSHKTVDINFRRLRWSTLWLMASAHILTRARSFRFHCVCKMTEGLTDNSFAQNLLASSEQKHHDLYEYDIDETVESSFLLRTSRVNEFW